MNIKELMQRKKTIVFYTLSIYLISIILFLAISAIIESKTNSIKRLEVSKSQERLVNIASSILSNRTDLLIPDLLYLSDDLNGTNFDSNTLKDIATKWKDFSDRKGIYDQIRFIDYNGTEQIRVDYSSDGALIVAKNKLQNKKHRYYFEDTITLKKNQVYISKLDLNVENNIVETPIKPMLRLSTPVFGKDNKLAGIVILNYYGENWLEDFQELASSATGNMFLLNSTGYWIFNSENKDKEWSFMYEDKKNISFKNEFPKEWDTIKSTESGTLLTSNGNFTYTSVITYSNIMNTTSNPIILGEGNWTVISFLPKSSEPGEIFFITPLEIILRLIKNTRLTLLFIFIMSLSFGILLTINKISKQRIKYFSEYDTMTGVYNRRAGFELLNKTYKNSMETNSKTSICFVDINGLKEVNDNLGHEAGDELILTVVEGIKKNIRKSDFVTRVGGDEFLVVFSNCDTNEAEAVWNKIRDEYTHINDTEERKYIVSVSHGIEECQFNSNEFIDNIINLADEKMYNEKRIMKKDLKIVRENI